MLRATTELIAYLKVEKSERDVTIIQSLVNAIMKCGNKTDMDAILNQLQDDPFDFHYSYLYPIFKKWGDEKVAAQIFKVAISNNRLLDANRPEVLALLGYLKYAPVKQVFVDYIFASRLNKFLVFCVVCSDTSSNDIFLSSAIFLATSITYRGSLR